MNTTLLNELRPIATNALNFAYVPYSHFPVGAALKLRDGRTFFGLNIENAAYGSTMCAERTAIFSAVANGATKGDFEGLLVTGKTEKPIAPCGACRQVMAEFFDDETVIYLTTQDNETYVETNLAGVLPGAFKELK